MGDPYEETTYQCQLIAIRVGQRHPALDEVLRCNDLTEWAFVTAWNRNGVLETMSSNKQGNEQLLEEAKQKGYIILPGWGIGDDRCWPPEASFLLLGINEQAAIALAQKYQQRALVVGESGGIAKLHYTSER